jgi:hypothetical protein
VPVSFQFPLPYHAENEIDIQNFSAKMAASSDKNLLTDITNYKFKLFRTTLLISSFQRGCPFALLKS